MQPDGVPHDTPAGPAGGTDGRPLALPDLPIVVTPHAVDRLVERIGSPREAAAAKIRAALGSIRSVRNGSHGHGFVVRTGPPLMLRIVLEYSEDRRSLAVVTVLQGSRTKGDREGQKRRAAERRALREAGDAGA